MRRALFAAVLLAPSSAAADCEPGVVLPAYAHNDYENARPLHDALALGYRGVEADVFLVDGQLLVAHDRKHTGTERSLEALYLRPLQERAGRCGGRIFTSLSPFVLNIEAKENDPPTFRAIANLLEQYAPLLTMVRDGLVHEGAVDVILVGHHPAIEEIERQSPRFYRLQLEVHRPEDLRAERNASIIGLVSVNYGRSIRWSGVGRPAAAAERQLEMLAQAKRDVPQCPVRVHNVPARRAVYRRLLAAGVDFIGTKDLRATHRILTSITTAQAPTKTRD